jgi:hypothetical protein
MSQPYEFFPGAAAPEPAGVFGQPVSSYGVAAPTLASPRDTPARPPMVSVLAGLLVGQAALTGAAAVTLLAARDVIGAAMDALTSGFAEAGGVTAAETSTSGTGRLSMWAVALLLATVLSAVSAVGVLDGRTWVLVAASVTEVVLAVCGLTHFGSLPSLSGVAVLLVVLIGGLLATPDVRRWCLTG